MRKYSIYLGNHLIFSRNKTKDFAKVKERVLARLESWNGHMLSKAGKMTLIKSVVQAIPTYSMATFKLLEGICDKWMKLLGNSGGNRIQRVRNSWL